MKYKQILTVIVVLLLSTTTALAAFESSESRAFDDFETYGDISDMSTNWDITGSTSIVSHSLEGDKSARVVTNADSFQLKSAHHVTADTSQSTNVSWLMYPHTRDTNNNLRVTVREPGGNNVGVQFSGFDTGGQGSSVSLDTGDNSDLFGDYDSHAWVEWTMEMDYANDRVCVYQNDSIHGCEVWDNVDQWGNGANLEVMVHMTSDESFAVDFDRIELSASDVISDDLEVELSKGTYMEPDTTQTYNVTHNQTLIDGQNVTDVTDSTTVTSNNTSIITVDEGTNELIANGTNSGATTITFEYSGLSENVTIFVGPRTIAHIGNLPSSQWFAAVMGFDEEGTWYVMGSEIQMVLLAVFIGAATAWKARNEYLGIGVIILAIILFWTADHVSIGMVMVSVFYGLFAAYQQRETPGRSDTNVNPNGGVNPERFRR